MACSKDCKKFGLAAFAGFLTLTTLEWLVHGPFLLGRVYMRPHYATLWNPQAEMKSRMSVLWLAHLLSVLFFTKLYVGGWEEGKSGVGQGLRFGAMAGCFVASYYALMSYFVYPVSCKLASAWFAALVMEFAIVGAVVGAIYQPKPHEHQAA